MFLSLLLLSLACAPTESTPATPVDDTTTPTPDDTADDTASDTTPTDVPAWSEVYTLLDTRCGDCHESDYIGHFVYRGDPDATYAALLAGKASHDATLPWVSPGAPAASYLIEKIGPSPSNGTQMPPEDQRQDPLTAAEADLLHAWVEGGAPG